MDPVLITITVILSLLLFYLIISGIKYTPKTEKKGATPKIANLNRFRIRETTGYFLAANHESGRMYMTKDIRKAGIFVVREVTSEFFYLEEQSSKFFVQFSYPLNYANRYDVYCNGTAHESEGNTSLIKMKYYKKDKKFSFSFYNGHSLVYSPDDLLVYSSNVTNGNTKIYATLESVE